jgi:hypothetical protein
MVELLHRHGLRQEILLPGTFEDLEMVLSVAELCILPGASQGLSWLMPTAVVSDLPTLMCDSPAARARLGSTAQALLFERGNAQHLRNRFEDWLLHPERWQQATAQAAAHVKRHAATLEHWRGLLDRCERSQRA